MDIKISAKYERTDARRTKTYSKRVSISVCGPAVEKPPTSNERRDKERRRCALFTYRDELLAEFEHLGGGDVDTPGKRKFTLAMADLVSFHRSPAVGSECAFYLSRYLPAAKPKEILSDEDARATLPSDDEIIELVTAAYNRAQEKHFAAEQEKQDRRVAQRVLSWLEERAETKAREVCRFEQRLAALQAEFKTEVRVQAAKELEEATYPDEDKFTDRVKALVEEHAVDHASDKIGGGLPSFFRGSCNNKQRWLDDKLGGEVD